MENWWQILVATIGFGAGGELYRRWRAYKHRRRALPHEVRNAGFWTDERLILGEVGVWLALLGPIVLFIAFVAGASWYGGQLATY